MNEYESVISYLIRKIIKIINKNDEKVDVIPKRRMKGQWRIRGLPIVGIFFTLLGVQFFDVTIFKGCNPKTDILKELEPQILSQINVEKETESQTPPQISTEKELEPQAPSQPIKVGDLPLSKLIGILKDLSSSFYRLRFIEDNISFMPDVFSLRELNDILNLFNSNSYRIRVTKIFLPRLENNYPDNEFERFKNHFATTSYRMRAINLLLRNKKEHIRVHN